MPPLSSFVLHPSSVRRNRRAFTLVELLVVLSLIVLALAAAVPAFNYITGSRSTDAAENMVSAMLQRARSLAIQSETMTGVLFFINPTDNRSTMALISSREGDDVYANYRGWNDSSFQQNTAGVSVSLKPTVYGLGQGVVALNLSDAQPTGVNPNPVLTNPDRYRNLVQTYVHDQTANQAPPYPNSPANSGWTVANLTFDLVADAPFETLPAEVGVQTINDPKGVARDRFLSTGVILFDGNGRVVSAPYKFKQGDQAYNLLAANPTSPSITYIPTSTGSLDTLYSQLGLVLYDRSAYLNQPNVTEGDLVYRQGGTTAGANLIKGLSGPTGPTESAEESWLDQNTTPLFVNRGNGTLLRGQ